MWLAAPRLQAGRSNNSCDHGAPRGDSSEEVTRRRRRRRADGDRRAPATESRIVLQALEQEELKQRSQCCRPRKRLGHRCHCHGCMLPPSVGRVECHTLRLAPPGDQQRPPASLSLVSRCACSCQD